MTETPNREVINADSLQWLKGRYFESIITSLPDMSELQLSLSNYHQWINNTCEILIESLQSNGCIIFYQTNKRHDGILVDKDFLISRNFYDAGFKKVFHRIVLRRAPETIDLYRPAYTNMFCFSKNLTCGKAKPDVIMAGKMLTPNAMGITACHTAVEFMKDRLNPKIIADPFCGVGTVLAIANYHGIDAVGVDIDIINAEKAKQLKIC